MEQTKQISLWASVVLIAASLLGCGNPMENANKDATITVGIPSSAVEQMGRSLNARAVTDKPTGVSRIIITVTRADNDEVLGSGDLLQAANSEITFTVPPHVNMKLTGDGYVGSLLHYKGSADVAALRPGGKGSATLELLDIIEPPPPPPPPVGTSFTIQSAQLGVSFSANSNFSLIQVGDGGAPLGEPIAQAIYDENTPNILTMVLPDTINGHDIETPDSSLIFRVTDDPAADPPTEFDARYTSKNVVIDTESGTGTLTINKKTTAVSKVVSKLGASSSKSGILVAVSPDEIDELMDLVNEMELYLNIPLGTSVDAYTADILNELDKNLVYRNIASSKAADGQICGNVQEITEGGNVALANIEIQVRDFNTRLRRAVTSTQSDGSYCLSVPNDGELNVLTNVNVTSNGEYFVGAMNNSNTRNVASAWWQENNNTTNLRINADKIILSDLTAGAEARAVLDPGSVDFNLNLGVNIAGTVSGADEVSIPLPGITVMVRDSQTHFLVAGAITDSNGKYVMNVKPGDYIIEARNTTPIITNQNRPYATATYISGNLAGSNKRNFGSVVSLNTGQNAGPFDFELDPGVYVSGKVTEPVNTVDQAVTGVRVVINKLHFEGGDGPSARLRVKNTEGEFGVWLKQDTYKISTHGQNQNVDLTTVLTGQALSPALSFNAQVAKLPVYVNTFVSEQFTEVSQMKFNLFEVGEGGINLKSSEISYGDGNVTLYSDSAANHILVGRIDNTRTNTRPSATTVYGGQNKKGFTQRELGERIALTPGQTAPTLNFNPLTKAGTLSGIVTDSANNPVPNLLVRVSRNVSVAPIHQIASNREGEFVQTRTRGDGSYSLSLPQATYDKVQFRETAGADVNYPICEYVPVFNNRTTTIDLIFTGNVGDCPAADYSQSGFTKVGNAYFDTANSKFIQNYDLMSDLTADWDFEDSGNINSLRYAFDQTSLTQDFQVPITIQTRSDPCGVTTISEALALDIGGGLYNLGTVLAASPSIPYADPVLLLPSELVVGGQWNITDGASPANTVKRGEIISFDLDSAQAPVTDYVHLSYTENVVAPTLPFVEEFYYHKGNGLQEEILNDPGGEIPPSTETWIRLTGPGNCGV